MQKKTWKSIIRHALTGVLAAVLALHTMAVPSLTAFAAAGDPVSYLDANGTKQTCSSYTDLASTTTSWSAGWYVVEGTVTISSRITVKGKAHLILADGATLTATKGITVSANGNGDLTIYAQSTGSDQGKLIASAADDYTAAIGGVGKKNGKELDRHVGVITINGGVITATGSTASKAAAIGGGYKGGCGTITINGGVVNASSNGVGIGAGTSDDSTVSGTVTINGGQVTAKGTTGITAKTSVSLGHRKYTDFIYADKYGLTPTLTSDFMLKDTDTQATASNAGGQTIVPRYNVTFYDGESEPLRAEEKSKDKNKN